MTVGALLVEGLVERAMRETSLSDLEDTLHTVEELADERREHRRDQVSLMARFEGLRQGLELGERTLLQTHLETLAPSIQEASLLAVVGSDGRLLAATGETLDRHHVASLPSAQVRPIQEALTGGPRGPNGAADGVWVLEDDSLELLEIAAAPVLGESGERLGAVVLAERLTGSVALRLQEMSPSRVMILADDRVVASSLDTPMDEARVRELFPEIADGALPETPERRIVLAGVPYMAQIVSSPVDFGGVRCNHVLLQSLEPAQELASSIRRNLILVMLAALALAFAAAWVGARRIALPLHELAERMSDISRSGRIEPPRLVGGEGREVRLLHDAFHRMLDSMGGAEEARERSYVEAIGAVMAAIDRRDQESAGHSYRVAYYAVALARRLGIRGQELRAVEWGALLHDVGKIAVPDQILRKGGPLTEKEWQIMRQHPRWGYEMLADVEFLRPALDIVYNHHERWDGTGYPRGLRGEEIPLPARIFSAVDTYDAITSDRHYRGARSHDSAVQELQRVAGNQLDPRVVGAFLQLSPLELRNLRALSEETVAGIKIPTPIEEILTELRTGTRG